MTFQFTVIADAGILWNIVIVVPFNFTFIGSRLVINNYLPKAEYKNVHYVRLISRFYTWSLHHVVHVIIILYCGQTVLIWYYFYRIWSFGSDTKLRWRHLCYYWICKIIWLLKFVMIWLWTTIISLPIYI